MNVDTFLGATDVADVTASFTNYGDCVDLFAPGVDVLSTILENQTESYSGTSMAAPHVSGVAARILGSAGATLTPEQVSKTTIVLKDIFVSTHKLMKNR